MTVTGEKEISKTRVHNLHKVFNKIQCRLEETDYYSEFECTIRAIPGSTKYTLIFNTDELIPTQKEEAIL